MRKEYGKALRKIFAERMKQELPKFEEVKIKSIYLPGGDRAYRWKASDMLHCWVVSSPSKKDRDEFTVLIGWSKKGRYPELSMVPCFDLPEPDRREFSNEEYLTRLPYLWTKEDKWWVIKEFYVPGSIEELQASLAPVPEIEAKEAVEPLVVDAIDRIKEYGIPYLDDFTGSVVKDKG